jgi:hypothetical protein
MISVLIRVCRDGKEIERRTVSMPQLPIVRECIVITSSKPPKDCILTYTCEVEKVYWLIENDVTALVTATILTGHYEV